jgi:adenine-specific DNA-methyltransferase
MTYEQQFLDALKSIFIGAKVEGDSGYINLMKIKANYFEKGVFPVLMKDIDSACKPFEKGFREELFDKLYDFFQHYFSESGSIYFRNTAQHHNIYEKVYTDDRDVMLFWKTHMLYYVKTDRLFNSMEIEVDGERFFFDVSDMQLKRSNEKRELTYTFKSIKNGVITLTVGYSEKGRKTKIDEIVKAIKDAGRGDSRIAPTEDALEKAFAVFQKQSEVDYFINKNAKGFLQEQFDLWMYQYIFKGESEFNELRLKQLQAMKGIATKIIDFIAQFEDELVKVWNKPKFALNSNYIITLDHVIARSALSATKQSPNGKGIASGKEQERPRNDILERIFKHKGMKDQIAEWIELGMADRKFKLDMVLEKDLLKEPANPQYQYLPLDTKYFKDLELDILALFDDLDSALDGWLIHSENYQALNTLLPKFRERVKAIYIDPPYNTGKDEFIYRDTFQHSSWLSMMNNRLGKATEYINKYGAILVSVDEVELSKLEELMRSTIGAENYVATYIWEGGRKNDSRLTSISHEYIVGFAKNLALLNQEKVEWKTRKEGIDDIYKKAKSLRKELGNDYHQISQRLSEWFDGLPDNYPAKRQKQYWAVDERGVYFPSDIGWHGGDGPQYEVLHPVTKKPCKVPERGWMYPTKERMLEAIADNRVHFWDDHTKVPSAKAYLADNEYEVINSVFYQDRRGATKRLRNMIGRDDQGEDIFKNPKDERIISKFFKAIGDSRDIFFDFFGGSGTTANAVINLNREDGKSRKYILVEMGQHFNTVVLTRIKKTVFSDKWKDKKAQEGKGISHFAKYFELEQYEDALKKARYEDAPLFQGAQDAYTSYAFLRDLKMLEAVKVNKKQNQVEVSLNRLYDGIDLAETLSCLTGKWIKRITKDSVEFQDGTSASLSAPDWDDVKPLIWW